MSEGKHTPGPWRINKYGSIGAGERGTEPILAFAEPFYGPDEKHGSTIANARLIAAAPELYEALKLAQEELRLIRMKDCATTYHPGLDVQISLPPGGSSMTDALLQTDDIEQWLEAYGKSECRKFSPSLVPYEKSGFAEAVALIAALKARVGELEAKLAKATPWEQICRRCGIRDSWKLDNDPQF